MLRLGGGREDSPVEIRGRAERVVRMAAGKTGRRSQRTLGARYWSGGRLMVSRAQSVFGPDGALQDDAVRRQLAEFVHGFAQFVAAGKAAG